VRVEVVEPVTVGAVVDALELRWPQLGGTIRDYHSRRRRAMVRFFAEQQDLSMLGMDVLLPESVVRGEDVLIVLGAIAGG
jgi:molybdopterin synthase sulfur carrier subunit